MAAPTFQLEQEVEHLSGWTGPVIGWIEEEDGSESVVVRPMTPRPREYRDGSPVGEEWAGWKPITVYADELRAR